MFQLLLICTEFLCIPFNYFNLRDFLLFPLIIFRKGLKARQVQAT